MCQEKRFLNTLFTYCSFFLSGGGIFWKDWKRRHCVLYRDGELSIYEKTTNATAELRINMRLDCKRIDVGFDCGGTINLPKGRGDVEALFAIVGKHKTHIFLAPSESECRFVSSLFFMLCYETTHMHLTHLIIFCS